MQQVATLSPANSWRCRSCCGPSSLQALTCADDLALRAACPQGWLVELDVYDLVAVHVVFDQHGPRGAQVKQRHHACRGSHGAGQAAVIEPQCCQLCVCLQGKKSHAIVWVTTVRLRRDFWSKVQCFQLCTGLQGCYRQHLDACAHSWAHIESLSWAIMILEVPATHVRPFQLTPHRICICLWGGGSSCASLGCSSPNYLQRSKGLQPDLAAGTARAPAVQARHVLCPLSRHTCSRWTLPQRCTSTPMGRRQQSHGLITSAMDSPLQPWTNHFSPGVTILDCAVFQCQLYFSSGSCSM